MKKILFVISMCLCFASQVMQSLKDANGYEEYDPDRVIAINVNPGLAFRTPTLWMNKCHSWGLMLRCNPGLCLSIFPNDKVTFYEMKDAQGVGHPTTMPDNLYHNDSDTLFASITGQF